MSGGTVVSPAWSSYSPLSFPHSGYSPGNQRVPGSPSQNQSPWPVFGISPTTAHRAQSPAARVPEIEPSLLRQVLNGPHKRPSPLPTPTQVINKKNCRVPGCATPTESSTLEQVVPTLNVRVTRLKSRSPSSSPSPSSSSSNNKSANTCTQCRCIKVIDLFEDSEIFATREE